VINMERISFNSDSTGVDWSQLKSSLVSDDFDNGRTPEQLRKSFENSQSVVLAFADGQVIGTARALSDGVCNAYVVDVWTHSAYRRRGVATRMMHLLLEPLEGQHIYLFTDDAKELYRKLGFAPQSVGMGKVEGEWLKAKE
jgi:predicted GNAT family acetyltransferase